jgi:allantoicase
VVVDTRGFPRDAPEECSVETIALAGDPDIVELVRRRWVEVIGRSAVRADAIDRFPSMIESPATHLRLVVYPDGGVARLRCLGDPIPPLDLVEHQEVDLASLRNGARVVDCSDPGGGSPNRMLLSEDPRRPGDGWETRRRRRPGNEWAVIRLAGRGRVARFVIDTRRFPGSAPAACGVEGIDAPGADPDDLRIASWTPLLPRTEIAPDAATTLEAPEGPGPFTHLRLALHPDGGLARFRAFGRAERPWTDSGPAGG